MVTQLVLDRELVKLGMTEKEAKIYLAGIQLGSSTVQRLSAKANINRATTYVIIEQLMQMGMMSTFDEGKKTFYVAEKPERLISFFERRKAEMADKVQAVKGMMPELEALYNDNSDKPRVKYYEGEEAPRALYQSLNDSYRNKNGGEFLAFLDLDYFNALSASKELEDSILERSEKGIRSRIIYTSRSGRNSEYESFCRILANKSVSNSGSSLFDFKFISSEVAPIKGGMNIYSNKVFLIDYTGSKGAIIIENESLTDFFRILFDLIWNSNSF